MFKRSVLGLLVIVTALWATDSAAQDRRQSRRHGKADDAVADGIKSGKRMRVIIQTRAGATTSMRTRAGKSGQFKQEYRDLAAFAAEVPATDLEAFLQDPDVLGVSMDSEVFTHNDSRGNNRDRDRDGNRVRDGRYDGYDSRRGNNWDGDGYSRWNRDDDRTGTRSRPSSTRSSCARCSA